MLKISIRGVFAQARSVLKVGLPVLAFSMLGSIMGAAPAQANFSEGYKFLEAVKKKEGEKVEEALMKSAQIINAKDVTSGETALHLVAARRDLTWLNFLIAKGANVNLADDRGRTALEIAVHLGWREGAALLLERKAFPDTSNDAGETPLIFAVHRKDANLVKALLDAGANPDRADNSGRSARDYAKIESGAQQVLNTIETHTKKGGVKASAPVYGPTF